MFATSYVIAPIREVLEVPYSFNFTIKYNTVIYPFSLHSFTICFIQGVLGDNARVIRVMPNTPMLVGKGASAFARGPNVTDCDIRVRQIITQSVILG